GISPDISSIGSGTIQGRLAHPVPYRDAQSYDWDFFTTTLVLWDWETNPSPISDFYSSGQSLTGVHLTIPTTVTPEPFGVALLGTGLAGVAVLRRRRRGGGE